MPELRPIETVYRGYRFRSRLEARWAVFFDALGIPFEYEPEGYVLPDGTHYLPDFWLPGFEVFAEVKPVQFSWEEFKRCCQLPHSSLLLDGMPAHRFYFVLDPQRETDGVYPGERWEEDFFESYRSGDSADACLIGWSVYEKRLWRSYGATAEDCIETDEAKAAVNAARGARFEGGQRSP